MIIYSSINLAAKIHCEASQSLGILLPTMFKGIHGIRNLSCFDMYSSWLLKKRFWMIWKSICRVEIYQNISEPCPHDRRQPTVLEALSGTWLAPRPAGGAMREATGLLLGRGVELVGALNDRSAIRASKSKAWEQEVYYIDILSRTHSVWTKETAQDFLLNEIDWMKRLFIKHHVATFEKLQCKERVGEKKG